MTGTLVHYDVDKDRYRVAFGGDEENAISVKASNFVQMLENVRLRDITSRPQLNGCQGQVIGVNGERYHVKLAGADSVVVSVALSNLILPTEVRVHVHSLSGAPQYNGKTGQVIQFLEADNRYLIEIEGNKQLKLKMDNLLI
jgi:ribosomal protein L21E